MVQWPPQLKTSRDKPKQQLHVALLLPSFFLERFVTSDVVPFSTTEPFFSHPPPHRCTRAIVAEAVAEDEISSPALGHGLGEAEDDGDGAETAISSGGFR